MDLFIARDGTVCKDAKEVEEHNRKREREAKTGVVHVYVKFIINARNTSEAIRKLLEFLPNTNDEINHKCMDIVCK